MKSEELGAWPPFSVEMYSDKSLVGMDPFFSWRDKREELGAWITFLLKIVKMEASDEDIATLLKYSEFLEKNKRNY